MSKQAVIIGAGPAGLTAALELVRRSDIVPIVLEATQEIGGISRTIVYKGNRMDIGGHRFFSKSDRVMDWWLDLMPVEEKAAGASITYRRSHTTLAGRGSAESQSERMLSTATASAHDHTNDPMLRMLVRPRKSRIYFLRQFFDYPIRLSPDTLRKLGLWRSIGIGLSYLRARIAPIRPEKSLEDFFINRFGRRLYLTFFKSYTEKVWGTPCSQISAEWGAQRIKGLSLLSAVKHFLRGLVKRDQSLEQRATETSLIEQFLYPRLGPGQLWEHAAEQVQQLGGQIKLGWKVTGLEVVNGRVTQVNAMNAEGERMSLKADYVFSTMPVRSLLRSLNPAPPREVLEISEGLQYRDFLTVGLLVKGLKPREQDGAPLRDTWIYIQEPDVEMGRLQIFNNWSPEMVADPATTWIGLEYFLNEGERLWMMADDDIVRFASAELEKIGLIGPNAVLDGHVVRVPKTYPAYFGAYERFGEVREFTDTLENLYLVGRNGMHKYNNQDHSMLTAMTAVDNILAGVTDKANLWEINTEQDYHEEKESMAESGSKAN